MRKQTRHHEALGRLVSTCRDKNGFYRLRHDPHMTHVRETSFNLHVLPKRKLYKQTGRKVIRLCYHVSYFLRCIIWTILTWLTSEFLHLRNSTYGPERFKIMKCLSFKKTQVLCPCELLYLKMEPHALPKCRLRPNWLHGVTSQKTVFL
jgi:hypothetical protein